MPFFWGEEFFEVNIFSIHFGIWGFTNGCQYIIQGGLPYDRFK